MSKKIVIIRNAAAHDFGGGERFPVFLANTLTDYGYDSVVVSRNPGLLTFAGSKNIQAIRGWWWGRQNWSGWRVVLFPMYVAWQLCLYIWYRHLFIQIHPAAVHIQSKDDFIAATFAARRMGIRVVWTDHADLKHIWENVTIPLKNPIGKMVRCAATHADAITAVSNSELAETTRHLPENSPLLRKISVVYNGCLDVHGDYPMLRRDEKITFILASRLVTDKGIGEALSAFILLHDKYSDTRLIVAGDGPERDTFIKQSEGADDISFVGHLDDPYAAIAEADVFLQPTYHEGFSVALVEASMLGKAIIATNVGGNVEIIRDQYTGLLVPPKDSATLMQAMEKLFVNEKLRLQLGTAARQQYLEKFQFDIIVKRSFLPLYEGGDQ